MGDLSRGEGGLPKGWGFPAPVYTRNWFGWRVAKTGGMVWNGAEPPAAEDFRALRAFAGEGVRIDAGTLVGRADPSYNTYYDRHFKPQKVRLG